MSESRIAWSSLTASGTRTIVVAAYGIRAYSACSPLTGPVALGPPKKHVPAAGPFGFAVSHCA
jgi:hypothetical protein